MKRYFLVLLLMLPAYLIIFPQASNDPLVSKCLNSIGSNAKYLKDFRVQLGEGSTAMTFRYSQPVVVEEYKIPLHDVYFR